MNYYPFHLGDYAAHTAHLEPMEDLAYRRMLDLYYRTEKPLPEPAEIARLIRMRDYAATVRDILNEFFCASEDGYRHARCDEEISRMQDKQAKAKASAQASVNARSANAQRTLSERSTVVELPTPTPTPTPKTSVPKGTGGKPPDEKPEDLEKRELFDAGKSLLAEQGMPKAQTGSFIGKLAKDYGQTAALEAVRSAVVNRPLGAAEYLKATCQRSSGERKDPVTVVDNPQSEATRLALAADREREKQLQSPEERAKVSEAVAKARERLTRVA